MKTQRFASFQLVSALALVFALSASAFGQEGMPRKSRQAMVVTTRGWDSMSASLQRFERLQDNVWIRVGEPIAVNVGKKGLGWGRGILDFTPASDWPVKHEGDGKAPAGIFRLGTAFGYAENAAFSRLPYTQAVETLHCVDDEKSRHYNQLIDARELGQVTWDSSEIMRRQDHQYKWGLVVEHNTEKTIPGAGSCIFMHIWKKPDSGTAGCTAMDEPRLREVMEWLDPSAEPVLVQMPDSVYAELREAAALP